MLRRNQFFDSDKCPLKWAQAVGVAISVLYLLLSSQLVFSQDDTSNSDVNDPLRPVITVGLPLVYSRGATFSGGGFGLSLFAKNLNWNVGRPGSPMRGNWEVGVMELFFPIERVPSVALLNVGYAFGESHQFFGAALIGASTNFGSPDTTMGPTVGFRLGTEILLIPQISLVPQVITTYSTHADFSLMSTIALEATWRFPLRERR